MGEYDKVKRWDCRLGKANHPGAMYSDRAEFDRMQKPTSTSIFRPQKIRENYFPLRKTRQKHFLGARGRFINLCNMKR